MSRGTAEQYLEMWLSEQIPVDEWLRIFKERKDVAKLYTEHMNGRNKNA